MRKTCQKLEPDTVLVASAGRICLRLPALPRCEIRRPGPPTIKLMKLILDLRNNCKMMMLIAEAFVMPVQLLVILLISGNLIFYQVMSSLPYSPPVFVKVVPSEKRNTPSSSLRETMQLLAFVQWMIVNLCTAQI